MLSPKYDEVTTIARDGCIRAWYWDTVDQADPSEEDPYVELNPVAETCVRILCPRNSNEVVLLSLVILPLTIATQTAPLRNGK